ncbi:elongation factor 4, partial [Leptospira borgpetersenii serovar Hardjo-bovis]|uniref:GTP-binding protein n=1 Tax=Leptospira borgpetersenii TaxID=174 RepID=UPI0019F10F0A
YEVNRNKKAWEGVNLRVDARQGVEEQTLANVYHAMEQDLEILPVMNKIDLPAADVEKTKIQIEESLGWDSEKAVAIWAKKGRKVKAVLEAIKKEIPAPKEDPKGPLKELINDPYFDPNMGVGSRFGGLTGRFKRGVGF